ncbi:MAG: hypothetical protein ACM3PY_00290 [Omnitrophica WOR_2 bacterium]
MSEIVECHAGAMYAEYPTAFIFEGQRLEVKNILRRWRDPGGKGFRVLTSDHRVFELFYNEAEDNWRVARL